MRRRDRGDPCPWLAADLFNTVSMSELSNHRPLSQNTIHNSLKYIPGNYYIKREDHHLNYFDKTSRRKRGHFWWDKN